MTREQNDGSVIGEWWDGVIATLSGIQKFWKLRRRILHEPHLAVAEHPPLPYKPLRFALYTIIVPVVIITATNTILRYIPQLPPLPLDRELATIQKAKDIAAEIGRNGRSLTMPSISDKDSNHKLDLLKKQVQREEDALKGIEHQLPFEVEMPLSFASIGVDPGQITKAQLTVLDSAAKNLQTQRKFTVLMEPIQKFIFPLALICTAVLFRLFLWRYRIEYPLARKADRAYLYYISSRLFFPNVILLIGLFGIGLTSRFTQWKVDDVATLNKMLIIICGIWGLVAFTCSAPALRRMLGFDIGRLSTRKYLVLNRLVLASLITTLSALACLAVLGMAVLSVASRGLG